MRTPAEAIAEILERIPAPDEPADLERAPLAEAAGRVLASEVLSDVDLPPFEKSAMDGFAVRSADFAGGASPELRCVGESRAGEPFSGPVPPGACVEIYTGAELPADTDAVVMVEHAARDGELVRFEGGVAAGRNVSHRAEILGVGRRVFEPGRRLSEIDLSILAAVGCDPVPAWRRPRVAVMTTGDELVPPSAMPGPGQIREGNTLYLASAARRIGLDVRAVGIVPDDRAELERSFGAALDECDALITTGGVSMGKYDLVGAALEALGVEPILHKVAIKPGKPIWFGMRGRTAVFGLPGNPVSSLLGFHAFVRPAMARMSGASADELRERTRIGRWRGGAVEPHWRQQNLPVRVRQAEDGVDELFPEAWRGSGDVVGLAEAGGLAIVPPDETAEDGRMLRYRPLGLG